MARVGRIISSSQSPVEAARLDRLGEAGDGDGGRAGKVGEASSGDGMLISDGR